MGVLPDDWTLPDITPINKAWFTSAQLAVQVCARCGARQHPPEEVCHACGGFEFSTETFSPKGTVYSYTIAHYPVNRALAASVPYAVVLVSLDEAPDVRVIGNVTDVPVEEIHIGMPVQAVWDERTAEDGQVIRLVQWHPA
jgi:uncharacterized OB-fold protein